MDKYNEIMEELNHMQDLLLKEIRKVNAKNDITPQELNNVKEAVCLMKDIIKLEEMMDGANYEYDKHSEYMPSMMHDSYRRGRSQTTGRYVSRHSIEDRMVASLESMMDQAGSDYERQRINDWIHKIRSEE